MAVLVKRTLMRGMYTTGFVAQFYSRFALSKGQAQSVREGKRFVLGVPVSLI